MAFRGVLVILFPHYPGRFLDDLDSMSNVSTLQSSHADLFERSYQKAVANWPVYAGLARRTA